MPRLAAIDGGTYFHHRTLKEPPFARYFDRVIYVRDVPFTELDVFDVVLVPCRLNAHLIAPLAGQLLDFWKGGGTLVAMGETHQDRWLPNIRLTPTETNFWWWLEPGADLGIQIAEPEHPLFRHIDREAATWHLHGYFTTSENQLSLIETREGECILLEDSVTHAPGRLIATTLDSCYHHGSHFMPATTTFLSGFLPWLSEKVPPAASCSAGVEKRDLRPL